MFWSAESADPIELGRQTRLLRIASRPLLVFAICGMVIVWIPGFTEVRLLGSLLSMVFVGVLLGIERLGRGPRIYLASLLFVLLVHGVLFACFVLFGGLNGPYIVSFPVVACIAGLVLRRRAALLSSLASSVVVAGSFALGQFGAKLPTLSPPGPVTQATVVVVLTGLLTYTLWIGLGQLEQARREWEALERERLAAHRLESIGRLAGGVAHDFNNLLTVILANSDVTEVAANEPEQIRRGLADIHAAGRRAQALTQQLLAFARQQVLEPQELDLNRLVTDLNSILTRLLRGNIDLRLELGLGLPLVRADPGQLEQVVLNLAVNAQEAMPDGGRLTLQTLTTVLDRDAGRLHPALMPGRYVALVVSDTGVGIPPELLGRVFDPFFTTKTQQGGTGLGLATVQGIVVQSGGAVLVESEPSRGTTFTVYLPAHEAAAVPESPPASVSVETAARGPLGRGRAVLVADDDTAVRTVVTRMLEVLGFRVLVADSAEQAQRLEAECTDGIDVLVTDVVMTRMGGLGLAERLQARRPGLKVLFMSGHSEDAVRSDGALRPGTRFLPKPFTMAGLEEHLRALLEAPN
jgi:signal transduction histidine kinase/CheY-like chemotaxis protein